MDPTEALKILTMLAFDYAKTLEDRPGTQALVLAGAQGAHQVLQRALAPPAAAEVGVHGNDPA